MNESAPPTTRGEITSASAHSHRRTHLIALRIAWVIVFALPWLWHGIELQQIRDRSWQSYEDQVAGGGLALMLLVVHALVLAFLTLTLTFFEKRTFLAIMIALLAVAIWALAASFGYISNSGYFDPSSLYHSDP